MRHLTLNDRRAVSWAQVAREVGGTGDGCAAGRRLSPSTIARIRTGTVADADGVLQMLRWLGRSLESLLRGRSVEPNKGERLPDVARGKVLRFDTAKLYAAIDSRKAARCLTWNQVADETGVSVAMLTQLAKGGRTGFPLVIRLVMWLNRRVSEFTRLSDT